MSGLASLETCKYFIQVFRLERACVICEKLGSLSEVEMKAIFQIEKVKPTVMPETPIVNAPVIERSRNERYRIVNRQTKFVNPKSLAFLQSTVH